MPLSVCATVCLEDLLTTHRIISKLSTTQLFKVRCDEMMRGKRPGTKCGNQDANYMAPEHWKHILYIWLTFSARSKLCLNKRFPPIPTNIQETQNSSKSPPFSPSICWGQGTLKLPMSFSKFSLCPPLGLPATCCSKGRRCENLASSSNSIHENSTTRAKTSHDSLAHVFRHISPMYRTNIRYNADHSEHHASYARNSKK